MTDRSPDAIGPASSGLEVSESTDSYAAAFTEWADDPDNGAWETATADA